LLIESLSHGKRLTEQHSKEVDQAVGAIQPYCQHCGSKVGHDEIIWTGDLESLHCHELWFCCHSCRDKNEPCESFFKLEKQS
jgi:hypothetical protein